MLAVFMPIHYIEERWVFAMSFAWSQSIMRSSFVIFLFCSEIFIDILSVLFGYQIVVFIICFNKLSSDVLVVLFQVLIVLFLSHVLDGHYINLCFFFIDPESIITGIALILVICLLGATMLTIQALVAYAL